MQSNNVLAALTRTGEWVQAHPDCVLLLWAVMAACFFGVMILMLIRSSRRMW
jgi:hypothetical protein